MSKKRFGECLKGRGQWSEIKGFDTDRLDFPRDRYWIDFAYPH